ncbi:unnamed protein product [Trichogramma brassicae]|uniref:Uncharacterized protein n=1 Tax=Trichogramma brassicae TaxID=86971 RepID=A0A6H5J0E2_9HYME|nr:unnamed protein product [Trichogramma brassicae]
MVDRQLLQEEHRRREIACLRIPIVPMSTCAAFYATLPREIIGKGPSRDIPCVQADENLHAAMPRRSRSDPPVPYSEVNMRIALH